MEQAGNETNSTMLAAVYETHGAPGEVVRVKSVKKPSITKDNQVLVEVYAAGMNPVNFKLVEGRLGLASPSLPEIDGLDIAGKVVQVGKNCQRIKVGDEIWGKVPIPHSGCTGSFAEYSILNENNVIIKPDEISFQEAAGLGVVALTGYQALVQVGKLHNEQKILILGGSGGTGSFAIQLAKHVCGAFVATTCSSRNIEFVKELGADKIINYREENWAEILQGENYDFIYDCVGGESHWEDAQKVLNPSTGHFLVCFFRLFWLFLFIFVCSLLLAIFLILLCLLLVNIYKLDLKLLVGRFLLCLVVLRMILLVLLLNYIMFVFYF